MLNNMFSEKCANYEMMWNTAVEPDRLQMVVYYGACALHAG
jgi:hypothetical protein